MTNQFDALRRHLEHAIVGQHALVERLLISLLADGHLLVEGLPGLAKTTAVRALASGLAMRFQRIQFTPDMIPGDITGTDIFVPRDGHFEFVEGPVFSDVILADEINRAPPKVQSALLEAMQERQVTVGTTTRALPPVFLVMATQNPIDHEGTYPLPEAQLDRFLLKVQLGYPTQDEELEILRRVSRQLASDTAAAVLPVLGSDDVLAARHAVNGIYLDAMLERYIVALVAATRDPSPWDAELGQWLERGASPRATLALARAGKARAWLHGRDFVEPGDLLELAHDVLNHRIAPSFTARAEGINAARIIERLLDIVPVP
ncbi:MAG: MoxR-like ATPase [Gammaproteobacteria bacterium]|nr:MAG: MoxR-like ATPase [Gammaproteobacteria bacterium]TND06217.1 MAG: MoxR-like ATPase [Gammaproteobacteria bacterium]